MTLLQAVALAGVVALLVVVWKDVRARSPLLGRVLLAGLVVRSGAGIALFVVSYWNFPVLQGLHTGDGFWEFAPDARMYYDNARVVIDRGLARAWDYGSPLYLVVYAGWMRLVGVNPSSGLWLNLLGYGLLCGIAARFFRPTASWKDDLPCAMLIGGFGLLPSIVAHSTQSLKDDMVIVAGCVALMAATAAFAASAGWGGLRTSAATAAISGLALLYLTGLRSYFALMIVVCLLPGAVVRTWTGRRALLATTLACGVFVLGSWSGYRAGEDPYWNPVAGGAATAAARPASEARARRIPSVRELFERLSSRTSRTIEAAGLRLRDSRRGFASSGGATNVASPADLNEAAGGLQAEGRALLLGYGLLFVPISVLTRLDVVDIAGGRGLLGITDLDTLLLDGMIAGIAVMSWRKRHLVRANVAFAVCAIGLFLLTATLLAYTVTNYGTLFRLRAMLLVPVWGLGLALRPAARG